MISVDAIVPCYNYARFLRECVESILCQQGVEVRVLILDDASPDETPAIARQLVAEDNRVQYRRHERNVGHIATYNEGIDWASAEYLILISADDYLLPGALKRSAELLARDANMAFCFGGAQELFPDGETRDMDTGMMFNAHLNASTFSGAEFVDHFRLNGMRNIVPTPTAVVRTVQQKRAGGYRPELPHAGDLEMWLRLASLGSVGFVASNQAIYRRHGRNMSTDYLGDNWFKDIRQRKDAVRSFFRECASRFEEGRVKEADLIWPLSLEAVSGANAAFNRGDMKLADGLALFAVELDPSVKRTRQWQLLRLRKVVGARAWKAIRWLLGRSSSPDTKLLDG